MKARSWLLAGVLAAAGLLGSARKADAQVYFGLGYPYGFGGGYPASYYSYATPYWGGYSPYSYLGGGYSAPYWYGRSYYNTSPFFGTRYNSYYYTNPGYGLGNYAYRWGRWRW